ncbi:MAG: hypothetical protein ACP5DZ_09095 [Bacteroidales bacterium]
MQIIKKLYLLMLLNIFLFGLNAVNAQSEFQVSSGVNNSNFFKPNIFNASVWDKFNGKNSYLVELSYLETMNNGNKNGFMLEHIHRKVHSSVLYDNGNTEEINWSMYFINFHYVYEKQLFSVNNFRISIPIAPYVGYCAWCCEKGAWKWRNIILNPIYECYSNKIWELNLGISTGLNFQYYFNDHFSILLHSDIEIDFVAPVSTDDWTITRIFVVTTGIAYNLSNGLNVFQKKSKK